MRKYILLVLVLLVTLNFIGCDIFAWKKYNNSDYNFSLTIPRNWEIQEDAKEAALVLFAPEDETIKQFRANLRVVVVDLPAVIPLTTYFDVNKEELMNVMPQSTNFTEGQQMNGLIRGQWMSFQTQITSNVVMKVISIVWMKDKRAYTLTCACSIAAAKQYDPIFRKIMSSMRIK